MSMQDIGVKVAENYNNGVKEGVRLAMDVLRVYFDALKWETSAVDIQRWEPGGDLGSSSEHAQKSSPERVAEVRKALGIEKPLEPYRAWLIERGSSQPEYFENARCGVALWTSDPAEALQFSSRQDADGALLIFDEELQFSGGEDVFRIQEHAFNG